MAGRKSFAAKRRRRLKKDMSNKIPHTKDPPSPSYGAAGAKALNWFLNRAGQNFDRIDKINRIVLAWFQNRGQNRTAAKLGGRKDI